MAGWLEFEKGGWGVSNKRGRLGTLCQLCIRSFSHEVGFLSSAEHLLDLKWEASDSFAMP